MSFVVCLIHNAMHDDIYEQNQCFANVTLHPWNSKCLSIVLLTNVRFHEIDLLALENKSTRNPLNQETQPNDYRKVQHSLQLGFIHNQTQSASHVACPR